MLYLTSTPSRPPSGRSGHTSLVLLDGSVLLMGGVGVVYYNDVWKYNDVYYNDVWKSTDGGITWTALTSNAAWSGE
jgi:hypothetical protein